MYILQTCMDWHYRRYLCRPDRSQYEIVYDECELVIPRQANTHTSYVEYGLSAGLIIQLAKWNNF